MKWSPGTVFKKLKLAENNYVKTSYLVGKNQTNRLAEKANSDQTVCQKSQKEKKEKKDIWTNQPGEGAILLWGKHTEIKGL